MIYDKLYVQYELFHLIPCTAQIPTPLSATGTSEVTCRNNIHTMMASCFTSR